MSKEDLKRRILIEIRSELERELTARGVSGRLEVNDRTAAVRTNERGVEAALEDLPQRWRHLPEQERRARVRQLVARLTPKGAMPSATSAVWSWLGVFSIGLLTSTLTVLLLQSAKRAPARAAQAAAEVNQETREQRVQRACEATRSRVMRGGTVGPTEHEGWLVELSLVTQAARTAEHAAAVAEFFAPGSDGRLQLVARDVPASTLGAPDGWVELVSRVEGELSEAVYVLHDAYAREYFGELGRERWTRLASALSTRAGAVLGALTARCVHQRANHVGVWFSGKDDSAAAAALLYYMGVFSETPVLLPEFVPDPKLQARPSLALLERLRERAKGAGRAELASWLGPDGGVVSSLGGRSALTFPYRDSNRASRASTRLARRLGIANER